MNGSSDSKKLVEGHGNRDQTHGQGIGGEILYHSPQKEGKANSTIKGPFRTCADSKCELGRKIERVKQQSNISRITSTTL